MSECGTCVAYFKRRWTNVTNVKKWNSRPAQKWSGPPGTLPILPITHPGPGWHWLFQSGNSVCVTCVLSTSPSLDSCVFLCHFLLFCSFLFYSCKAHRIVSVYEISYFNELVLPCLCRYHIKTWCVPLDWQNKDKHKTLYNGTFIFAVKVWQCNHSSKSFKKDQKEPWQARKQTLKYNRKQWIN